MLIEANRPRTVGRKSRRARRAVPGVLLAALTLLATAFTGAAAAGESSVTAGPVAEDGGKSRLVIVEMVDYRFLQPKFLPPGRYTFRAVNEGNAPHALQIAGPGMTSARTGVVQAGGVADLNVTLYPGVYDFWCPVGNHRQMGMQLDVFVG